jgi:hypothetical protein
MRSTGCFTVKHPTTGTSSSQRSCPPSSHAEREISPLDTPKEKKMREVRERIFQLLLEIPSGFPHSQCFDGGRYSYLRPGLISLHLEPELLSPQGACKFSPRHKTEINSRCSHLSKGLVSASCALSAQIYGALRGVPARWGVGRRGRFCFCRRLQDVVTFTVRKNARCSSRVPCDSPTRACRFHSTRG